MSVEIGTGLELIEHLDFDHEVPCTSRAMGGNRNCPTDDPAEWRVVGVCCDSIGLLCNTCFERKSNGLVISSCGQQYNPGRLSWASVERIKP